MTTNVAEATISVRSDDRARRSACAVEAHQDWKKRPPLACEDLRSPAGCGFNSLAHSIGTKVSDTIAEMTIVTASVIANSWNSRPTTSPMNNNGISTAISEMVSEMIVKPICSIP